MKRLCLTRVISPVTVPTEWCSGIVPVPKPNGRVRICVDLTPLNKAVQRKTHPMGSVDKSLAMLGESRLFMKLDANSGFWQIPVDDESKLLTTFITPFGCFCFNHLPFEIAVITVEPADKISFVYNCMQTRLRGQYNGK